MGPPLVVIATHVEPSRNLVDGMEAELSNVLQKLKLVPFVPAGPCGPVVP
jgi:hypothetical protein